MFAKFTSRICLTLSAFAGSLPAAAATQLTDVYCRSMSEGIGEMFEYRLGLRDRHPKEEAHLYGLFPLQNFPGFFIEVHSAIGVRDQQRILLYVKTDEEVRTGKQATAETSGPLSVRLTFRLGPEQKHVVIACDLSPI